jgi:hypothetical protein
MGENRIYVTYYAFWSKIVLMEAFPYAVILILNSIIVSKIFESINFRSKFQITNQRNELNECSNKHDSNTPKVTFHNTGRRQSSPLLNTKLSTQGHQNICFLSSSNLTNVDSNVAETQTSGSILLSSFPTQVHVRMFIEHYNIFKLSYIYIATEFYQHLNINL